MWRIWLAPNNVSKWHTGFNSAFEGLNLFSPIDVLLPDWQTHDKVWQWNYMPPILLHTSQQNAMNEGLNNNLLPKHTF